MNIKNTHLLLKTLFLLKILDNLLFLFYTKKTNGGVNMPILTLAELNDRHIIFKEMLFRKLFPYDYVENYIFSPTPVSSFIFVLDGTATIKSDNFSPFQLEKGSLCYIPKNSTYTFSEDEKYAYIELDFEIYDYETNEEIYLEKYPTLIYQKTPTEISDIINNIINISTYSSYGNNLKYTSLIFNMFYTMLRHKHFDVPQNSDYSKIAKSIKYMEENVTNTLTCVDFAKMCNLSESHFRKLFKQQMNMTPMQYNNVVKIKYACQHLKTSNCRILTLSDYLGFANPSDFCHLFKKLVGVSASEYRKKK